MEAIALAAIGGGIGAIGAYWSFKKIYEYLEVFNAIRDVEREGWTHIGTVKFMCIYPIDGGYGMQTDIANFGRLGFHTIPEYRNGQSWTHYDRSFVIHDMNFNPPRAVLSKPQIFLKSDLNEMVSSLWDMLKIVANTVDVRSVYRNIEYLSRDLRVAVSNQSVCTKAQVAFNLEGNNRYKIAFCSPVERINFNRNARHLHELYQNPNCHLPYYTSCTMVNTKSIDHLRRATGRVDLSHKNFRPQIVFKGKRPYIEENVRSIKIGNLEFHNVRPCVHDDSINENYEFPVEDNHDAPDLHRYLTSHRPLNRLIRTPYPNANNPVFGINFHFDPREQVENEDGDFIEVVDVRETENPAFFTIVKGHEVYARYEEPADNRNAEAEIAL